MWENFHGINTTRGILLLGANRLLHTMSGERGGGGGGLLPTVSCKGAYKKLHFFFRYIKGAVSG